MTMAASAIVLDLKSVPEPPASLPSMGLNLGSTSELQTQSSDVLESVLKSLQRQLELIDIQEKPSRKSTRTCRTLIKPS